MLPKIIVGVVLIILAVLTFGLIFKKGEPPHFLSGSPTTKQTNCPKPLILQTPVDLSKVTSILYPGQVRGGDFKPHGGFRFDNSKPEEIEVKAPMEAKFVEGSRYIEQGEVQYMFDFQTPCGIRYRFDHLLVLTPKFAKIAESLPKPKENDSRTSRITSELSVITGEVIATAVGFRRNNNTFVDLGVYDLRGKNPYQNPRPYAVCWFDLLPASDSAKIKSLPPADSISGSQSTLCKF